MAVAPHTLCYLTARDALLQSDGREMSAAIPETQLLPKAPSFLHLIENFSVHNRQARLSPVLRIEQ